MFEVDPERSWVDPGAGSITSLIQSLNTPLVAAGQHPAENVQSWIVTRGANAGQVEVFVYFHLTESNQAVLYRWDGGPVPGASQEQVVEEAMGFCESMGFMMDNLNFGALPPDKRGELLQTLPPFLSDLANLQNGKEPEEIPLSMSKKIVDPVEEFAKARAAAQGQPTANDFADPGGSMDSFDPMSLMDDVGIVRGSPASSGGDMQIEITEIEGLELMPAADGGAPRGRVESSVRELDLEEDEPPLVVGSASMPAVRPAAPAPAPVKPPVAPAPPADPPVVRGRERTPAGEVTVFDDASSAPKPVSPPLAAAAAPTSTMTAPPPPAKPAPAAVVTAEPSDDGDFNMDDLLGDLDVGAPKTNGAAEKPAAASSDEIDVGSALDDILDGVESSKSPAKPAASAPAPAMAAAPAKSAETENEIGLDIDLDFEGSAEASISSPDEALVALEALGIGEEGIPSDEPPAPAAPEKPAPPPVRPAVEAAWASEATQGAAQVKANGNGKPNGASAPAGVKLDISTDDLARLLSML